MTFEEQPTARYFPATILGGRLHGSTGEGPWDSSRLDWWREDELDLILARGNYGVKIRTTPEELEAALRAPTGVTPTRRVWDPRVPERRRATSGYPGNYIVERGPLP